MRKKIEIIFICAFILFNSAVIYARNANDYSEKNIEIMQNEIDTLKFRINELTREIALLKTALMKVSAPAPQQKKNNNAAAVENRNVKTAPQPARYGINTVISNENLPGAQRVQSGESGTRKNTGFDYNIIYQSRAEINQPIRYSMILPSGQNKNLMLVFEFSNNMMIAEEMFSGNISLVSEKKKGQKICFQDKSEYRHC